MARTKGLLVPDNAGIACGLVAPDGILLNPPEPFRRCATRASGSRTPRLVIFPIGRAAVAGVLVLVAGAALAADAEPGWRDRVTFTVSNRVRGEFVDWFEPPPGTAPPRAERYSFLGNQFRLGTRVTL